MEPSGKASQSERQDRRQSSSPSRKRRSQRWDRGSSLGNLAQSLVDRPNLLLAAAAAGGTLLMSLWLGENGWLRRSFGRGDDEESFIPRGSWAEAQGDDEESFIPGGSWAEAQGDDDESEVPYASQHDAVAQAGDRSQGSAAQGQGNVQAGPGSSSSPIKP